MRLDKYLKVSRLIKRRTLANEACDRGLISVNGKVQRASYDVKPGDHLTLNFSEHSVTVEVLEIRESVAASDAALLYREISRS